MWTIDISKIKHKCFIIFKSNISFKNLCNNNLFRQVPYNWKICYISNTYDANLGKTFHKSYKLIQLLFYPRQSDNMNSEYHLSNSISKSLT